MSRFRRRPIDDLRDNLAEMYDNGALADFVSAVGWMTILSAVPLIVLAIFRICNA